MHTSSNTDIYNTTFLFPMHQNASPSVVGKQIQQFESTLNVLHDQMMNGMCERQTNFMHTPIFRTIHHERMAEIERSHDKLRNQARITHIQLCDRTEEAIEQLERTRKMLVNAKRVRNTLQNQLSRVSEVRNNHYVKSQISEHYINTARELTNQVRWLFKEIHICISEVRTNIHSKLMFLTNNAAMCKIENEEALKMALYEFSLENLHNKVGAQVLVHVEKHISGYQVTIFDSNNFCIKNQSVVKLKNFSPEKHCDKNALIKFQSLQREFIESTFDFSAFDDASFDDDFEEHDDYNDDRWIADAEVEGDDVVESEEETQQEEQLHDVVVDYDTTPTTPKASSSHNSHNSHNSHHIRGIKKHTHNQKRVQFKKDKQNANSSQYHDFAHTFQNTNHTTGTLKQEDSQSKQYQDHAKQMCKELTKLKRSSKTGGRHGRSGKNVFERWNKDGATTKMMSQMISCD